MKIKITLLTLLFTVLSFAQKGINYKALIKDDLGNVLVNTIITVQLTIKKGTVPIYTENHDTSTDANGIVILNIGEGTLPVGGAYANIDWGNDDYFLYVKVNIGSGFIDMGTTEFKAVPYALSAAKAKNIGLEALDEGNGIGWRIKGRDIDRYGQIGQEAVDLSSSTLPSTIVGATGKNSFAVGRNTTASNHYSIAMGDRTTASGSYAIAMGESTIASGVSSIALGKSTKALGLYSTAMGESTIAASYKSTAIGSNNIGLGSTGTWLPTDPLFEIGNGKLPSSKSNALTVLKSGNVGIGNHMPKSLLEVSHKDGSPTTTDFSNAFSIRNSDHTDQSWQFHVNSLGALVLYYHGIYSGFFQTTGEYFVTSDRRLKKDIEPLEANTLQKVMQLNPVSYKMINQPDAGLQFGLISQEVQKIYPSLTEMVGDQDILALSYSELIPVLIKAIQEQQEVISSLQSTVGSQQTTIENQDSKTKDLTADFDQRLKHIETILKTSQQ